MNNPRVAAIKIVSRFIGNDAWVTPLIRSSCNNFKDTREAELMTELVYGTVKNFIKLSKIANTYLARGNLESLSPTQRALILISIYEFLFLTRIPEYATIHSYVEISKKLVNAKFSKVLNALLRNIQRKTKKVELEPHEEFSINKELYNYLKQKLDPVFFNNLLHHSLMPHKLYIRCDNLIGKKKINSRLFSKYNLENVLFPETFRVNNIASLSKCSQCENPVFQDLSTQIAQHLIPYVPRGTYLDLTSAPSLKSSYLSKCYPDILIISNDVNFKKIKKARDNFASHNHLFVCSDGLIPPFKRTFDVVILDPPCSGLGTLRRKPEIKIKTSVSKIEKLKKAQRNLLGVAAQLTGLKGYLCYMTCTINPEENEEMIGNFLKHEEDFIIETIKTDGIEVIQKDCGCYIDGLKYDCDFFFLSILRRVKNETIHFNRYGRNLGADILEGAQGEDF